MLTQTQPHNCFQTCVAMILEQDVADLPQQQSTETHADYVKRVRIYLDKHYGLTYVEAAPGVAPVSGFHVMVGETVRSSENGGKWHAVVGQRGRVYWDVHPSRAGLVKVGGIGFFTKAWPEWRATWMGESCSCPRCVSEVTTR